MRGCQASTVRSEIRFRRNSRMVLATLLMTSTGALAQGPEGEGPPETSFALGVGVMAEQRAYKGIDRKYLPLPLIQFENKYVNIFGPQIGLKLPGFEFSDSQELNFSIIGKWEGDGYKSKDAPILDGMNARKSSLWAGAEVEWKNDIADVKASWLADIAGNSKGKQITLEVEKSWHFGESIMLTPHVAATWQDTHYVNYYYGVNSNEVRPGRAAYEGSSGTNVEYGIRGIYLLNEKHSFMLDVGVTSLSSAIKNSPLINRSTEDRLMLVYMYRFL